MRGEKTAFIAHILGTSANQKKDACKHASQEAIDEAKEQSLIIAEAKSKQKNPGKHARTSSTDLSSTGPAKKPKFAQPGIAAHMFPGTEMPFSQAQIAAIQAQALRAQISANLPFHAYENVEMLKLFQMMHTAAPAIMPTAKVLGGRLLDDAVKVVNQKLCVMLEGRTDVGLCADGWKSATKGLVNGICINVDYKVSWSFLSSWRTQIRSKMD